VKEQVCREQVERELLCRVKSRDKFMLKVSSLAPILREKKLCGQSCREQVCREQEGNKCAGIVNKCAGNKRTGNKCAGNKRTGHTYF